MMATDAMNHVVDSKLFDFERGIDYVNFNLDRVAMQDATAQMAMLQFMMAKRDKVYVPTTIHADHLIQAKINSKVDLKNALDQNPVPFNKNDIFLTLNKLLLD